MTVCIFTSSLGTQWFYPVADPYRTAGAGPYHYGYVFVWDAVEVTVTRNFSLSRCRMRVELSSTLPETKEIQAFNFYNDTLFANGTDRRFTSSSGARSSVSQIRRRS